MQSAIKVTASQLRKREGPYLTWQGGSDKAFAIGVGTPDALSSTQLAFVSKLEFLTQALEKASLLIVEAKILPGSLDLRPDQALWSTPSLKAAMAITLPLFDPRHQSVPDPLISNQAHVHSTAKIGVGTRIEAGAFVGAGAEIGENSYIHSGVVIEAFCKVGSRCEIHATSTIGSDGFGFITDPKGVQHKIPQIGIVVIEDDVEIGSGNSIDRATIGETRIGQGTKIDNNCHIAHNCSIGKHGLIAGGFFMAGSSTIGDHFMVGGVATVSDHINICDNVMLGGRAAVTKDITVPGAYTGYPLQPLKEGLKTAQNLTHLTSMRRQIKMISKRMGMPEESE